MRSYYLAVGSSEMKDKISLLAYGFSSHEDMKYKFSITSTYVCLGSYT